ncbi:MAG: cupin domain-containing protein [Euryarchaeota archaeon]|nr:cupin domain-containing protein [Euryarchaeota archaeon]
MRHAHYTEVKAEDPGQGSKDITIRWLITKKDGAERFAMRMFEMSTGGYTPYHQHDWEHEVFIVEGEGALKTEKGERKFKGGDFIFVPAGEWHQFLQKGKGPTKFLCLIPYKD